MTEIEKVPTTASRKSDQPESLSRVYSAPHIDNHSAFYATSKEANGPETDFAVPTYTDKDGDPSSQDLESGSVKGNANDPVALQTIETAKSERDPKLVSIDSRQVLAPSN